MTTTFRSGNLSAVCIDNIDGSPFLNTAGWTETLETAETTHFGDAAKEYIAGKSDGKVTMGGMFDAMNIVTNPTGISADAVLNGLDAKSGNFPVTLFLDGGIAVGRRCRIAAGIMADYDITAPIGGVVSIKVDTQLSAPMHGAFCLTDAVPETTTTPVLYAGIDNGSVITSTPNGIQVSVHSIANTWTGTTSVKIQHSVDNSVWVDLITQVVPAATQIGYLLSAAGTINRYVRCTVTPATGSGSVNIIAAFARN